MQSTRHHEVTPPVPQADPRLRVPAKQIQRLRWPDELTPERFETEFVAASTPCIISGLIDDWPAYADAERTWRGDRWDKLLGDTQIDAGFDPADNRMMHFGDDEGEPSVLFNPGRLRMPVWAFLEVARLRQRILQERLRNGNQQIRLQDHPDIQHRLGRELLVQNVPFLAIDEDSPLQYFAPIVCRIRDLMPLSFYLSHDTYALPKAMQEDLGPQTAGRLMPGWHQPDSSRIWVTNGGPWRTPYPPWSNGTAPEPLDDARIYSCFHCDRMENLHSLLAGEKEVVLIPPGQRDVLGATRYSTQNQWLLAPVAGGCGTGNYLGSTVMTSRTQIECTSDQSAVHPLRSPDSNRRASGGRWPDKVDFPVFTGRLHKGDTLYIPAYHWHWVATATPPVLGLPEDGPLAMSVNYWWWPVHNDDAMERWSYQNEVESWQNRRIPMPSQNAPFSPQAHAMSFYKLTQQKRAEAAQPKSWPCPPPRNQFEVVD